MFLSLMNLSESWIISLLRDRAALNTATASEDVKLFAA